MPPFAARRIRRLRGTVYLPGDKSIAHRCVIMSSLVRGKTCLRNFPLNDDCLATARIFKSLGAGIEVDRRSGIVRVFGKGMFLRQPSKPLHCKDSGTTFRLTLGVLAGQQFESTLTAAASLSRRPMRRVTVPLRFMGARLNSRTRRSAEGTEEFPPVTVRGGALAGRTHRLSVASAQVKSAILLAGLYARGTTRVIEKERTRDHTERMIRQFNGDVSTRGRTVILKPGNTLVSPGNISIPGDISSAAFFMVMASLVPDSKIVLKGISVNPGRTGIIRVLGRMGASIEVKSCGAGAEPCADITVRTSSLKATRVAASEVPSLIDELPVLMVAAAAAQGTTVFQGVRELRVKESDRLRAMTGNLRLMGVGCSIVRKGKDESLRVEGGRPLRGAAVKSCADHRVAMAMVVAGSIAEGMTRIDDIACVSKSFPGFIKSLNKLAK